MTNESAARQSTIVAFYSSTDEAGRSCLVANIALILASLGRQVLVVDHDLTSPSLHRYLSAFLPATPAAAGRGVPVRLECEFGRPGGIIDFVGPAADEAVSSDTCIVSRSDLLAQDYDFVLIDTPAGADPSPIAEDLADIVVLGFPLIDRKRDLAERLARRIEASSRGNDIRVLPVPMRVDQTAVQATAKQRMRAHGQFGWLVEDLTEAERQRYWDEVEIPDEPEYAAAAALAVLDPPSASRDRLVSAYLGLAGLLAEIPDLTTFEAPEPVRGRYLEVLRESARQGKTVTILHAAADRYWAEWIATSLQAMGYTGVRRRIDRFRPEDPPSGATLIVVSARLGNVPGVEDLLRRVVGRAEADSQVPGAVSIDGTWLPTGLFPNPGKVSLGRNAREAREVLASYYQARESIVPPLNQPFFPGGREKIAVNLPAFTPGLVSRDDIIDQIRDHFTARETPPLTLTGPAGAGKTQIALEYAYRFRANYDVIAVIRADSPEAVQTGLGQLKAQVAPGNPAGALETLTFPPKRCLLIYSGADDPSVLDELVQEADDIHVLVTAREAVRDGSTPLSVPQLTPAEAAAMVSGMVGEILPDDATWVAEAMGGSPLALRLAGAWLQANAGRLSGFDADPATLTQDAVKGLKFRVDEEPGGDFDPVAFAIRLHLDELAFGGLGKAAALLLETCAFLGSSGLPWRILRSPAMLTRLADEDPEMSDPILLPSLLHELAGRGLLLLDDAELLPGDITRVPLRVHPRVLDVVRSRLGPEPRAERMRWVSTLLAASVPPGIVDDVIEGEDLYAELREHLAPSGAITQTDDAVRHWLVNQVRYLWQSDNQASWEAAANLGESLREHWLSALPGNEAARRDDRIMLQLCTQLANVYRSLNELNRARTMDEDTLVRQRRVLGLKHPRTLMTARSYGADLRLVGDFEEALLTDQATWQLATQAMGRNHPLALTASGNLALSELLAGEPEPALERREKLDLRWCQRFEEQRPEESAWVLGHIGVLQRELGLYEQSLKSLRLARDGFQRAASGGTSAPSSLEVLRVDSDIAIVERRLRRPRPEINQGLLKRCREAAVETRRLVWAIVLSMAGDLARLNKPGEAVRKAQEALEGHVSVFGRDHPFTSINRVDLANYALTAGQFELADEMSGLAHGSLESSLGPRHLWTVASAVCRANVLAVTGHLEEAAVLEDRVLGAYQVRLGAHHPFTQVARENSRHTHWLRNEPRSAIDPAAEAKRRQMVELDIPPY